jgi:uncharacterized protein YprB with RNaseH-like and TPR domain
MSVLAERLAGLRAQAGANSTGESARVASGSFASSSLAAPLLATPRSETGAIELDASTHASSPIPEQLRRLLGIRLRSTPAPLQVDRALPGTEIASGVRLVETSYAWGHMPARLNAQFARFGSIARDSLLYFDTETTGLSGGTGTRAFMIGAADWNEGGLRVRQLLLTTMAGEHAMLETFAGWLSSETVLVSYNGRSYDAPLLATRYRLARQPNPLAGLRHLDLLHPVRRRFRGVWENCRLGTVERNWLGLQREDDLPGSEAPRAWRDYLRGLGAGDLRRVLGHNDQDLRSLATLLHRLAGTETLCLESDRR